MNSLNSMSISLHKGDSNELLQSLPDNFCDSVVIDPPYHFPTLTKRFGKKNSKQAALGKDGLFQRISNDFLNKSWDGTDKNGVGIAHNVGFWQQVFRILKPGGHVLAFSSTKTYHKLATAMEAAGFEIRDIICWLYGTGFPKSLKIGTGTSGNTQTSGTALKPANEPICLARKPISEKSIALNVAKWGTGALNIDSCRITTNTSKFKNGRYPSNIIVDELSAKILDLQSGHSENQQLSKVYHGIYGKWWSQDNDQSNVEGGPSKFFYCPKASTKEKNYGLGPMKNTHPTVKPIELMSYLCKLITPAKGIIIDPMMGSGSTIIAAKLAGFSAIGMEKDVGYFEIAKKRIAFLDSEPINKAA